MSLILRTTIQPSLMRKTLFKGIGLAAIGIGLWLYGGFFLSADEWSLTGFFSFFLGVLLLAWGLIPYRQLALLEAHPHELILNESECLDYCLKGKKVLVVPLSLIENIHYIETPQLYGLAIELNRSLQEKVKVYQPRFLKNLRHPRLSFFKHDLFFPYFSGRSVKELQEWLKKEED